MVQQISDAELEIMKIVWGNPEDVTLFSYIMDGLAARGKPCQKNTLIVLLSRLMAKGYLSARKIGRRNEYEALATASDYQAAQTLTLVNKLYEGEAWGLAATLIERKMLTAEDCAELRRYWERNGET